MADLNATLSRRDMLRIRTLVLKNGPVLQNWGLLQDDMITQAVDNLRITHQLRDCDFAGAVMATLENWKARDPLNATVSKFMSISEAHGFVNFAKEVEGEFTKPEPSTTGTRERTETRDLAPALQAQRGPQACGDPNVDFKREVTASLFDIMENVDNINQLLAILLSMDVIGVNELELVQSKPTKSDKLSTLTLLFTRKTPAAWEKFKGALADTGNAEVVDRIGRR